MRLHIDVLGILHLVWGAFGVMTGVSLAILAVGTWAALTGPAFGMGERAAVLVLTVTAGLLVAGGAATVGTGFALRRHRGRGRVAALVLAVPNLVFLPFGTALGVYTFWVLLNNDARATFGRRSRTAVQPVP